jgi:heme/copper-type cytochrome/quinol oxidase subunit 4
MLAKILAILFPVSLILAVVLKDRYVSRFGALLIMSFGIVSIMVAICMFAFTADKKAKREKMVNNFLPDSE